MRGEYPVVGIEFDDTALAVDVALTA